METWAPLLDLLVVLAAAIVCGTALERLRQSAVLGYLLAGTLVGPGGFGLVANDASVRGIAELGVALLLFSIGLEFSFRRLRRLGRVVVVEGGLQVLATLLAAAVVAAFLGTGLRGSLAIGAMLALSSTACVLRLLTDRSAIDATYGRASLGILLVQDVAVVPLALLVLVLGGGSTEAAADALGRSIILGTVLVGVGLVLARHVLQRLLRLDRWARNRELPVLLALVIALGAAYAAHSIGVSPAIGAFIAGVLLGESPFAVQIRSDVGALRMVLVTLFFASIGMLADLAWIAGNLLPVIGTVALVVAGKTAIVWGLLRATGRPHGVALATGLCISQVGEFAFVLGAKVRDAGGILSEDAFRLLASAMIGTLLATPFLVALAPRAGALVARLGRARGPSDRPEEPTVEPGHRHDIFIIGFGPAGQAVAMALHFRHRQRIAVIELSPRSLDAARRLDIAAHVGDATSPDVLDHAGVPGAAVVVITVPDPETVRLLVQLCRSIAPSAAVIARSRYHVRRWELVLAGAAEVVDEEEQVGLRLAAAVRRFIGPPPEGGPPPADLP